MLIKRNSNFIESLLYPKPYVDICMYYFVWFLHSSSWVDVIALPFPALHHNQPCCRLREIESLQKGTHKAMAELGWWPNVYLNLKLKVLMGILYGFTTQSGWEDRRKELRYSNWIFHILLQWWIHIASAIRLGALEMTNMRFIPFCVSRI